jgi:hypothetical protein
VAAIDTQRWQLARFCNAMTQTLKLKTCLGTSENAGMPPSWVALLTYLILVFLRFTTGLGIAFQQMRRPLPIKLFDRRDRLDRFKP